MTKIWLFFLAFALAAQAASPTSEDPALWLKKTIGPCFTKNDKASFAAREKIERSAVTPTLKALIARDNAEIARTHEVGRIDFDWVLNAQDVSTDWKVGAAKPAGKYIAIPVTVRWSDGSRTHTFLLQPDGNSWLIADVKYPPDNMSLLKILQ